MGSSELAMYIHLLKLPICIASVVCSVFANIVLPMSAGFSWALFAPFITVFGSFVV